MMNLLFASNKYRWWYLSWDIADATVFGKTPVSMRFSIFVLQIFFESNEFIYSNIWSWFLRGFVGDLIDFFDEKSREKDVREKFQFWSNFQISFCKYLKMRKKKWMMVFMSFERRIVMSYKSCPLTLYPPPHGRRAEKKVIVSLVS